MLHGNLMNAGHVMHKCADDCNGCVYCDGGLAYCVNCKRGEAEFYDASGEVIVCDAVPSTDLLQGCAVIRCSHCGCPSVQEPGHDYCQTCARSTGLQGAPAARFIDAWSRWALNSYVCTDQHTRANLRVLREHLALDEVDGDESWEVDKLYRQMVDSRAALEGGDES